MAWGWEMLTRAHVASGHAAEAVTSVQRWHQSAVRGAPDDAAVTRLHEAVAAQGPLGYWAWQLDRLNRYEADGRIVPRTELAAAHAALGNTDEAFGFLFEAIARWERGIFSLRTDPVWDDLRRDPRFSQLARDVRNMRFSPTRRALRGGSR
jgi:hypothetical protein